MSEARYSLPLPETQRADSGQVVFAGFTRDGSPGYIVREYGRREIREESRAENRAVESPAGFFRSLARLWAGGRT